MKHKEENSDTTMQSLQLIPGVGPKMSQLLSDIGIRRISDLKGKKPKDLYTQICAKQGIQVDRCVLYVCRSSVYFSETEYPDPAKLKWWYWKDKR